MAPKVGEAATQGASAGKKPHRPRSLRDPDDDEIQVVKVQPGGFDPANEGKGEAV